MGQFIVVQGPDPRAVREVFDGALGAFEAAYGGRPSDLLAGGTVRVAKFPRALVPGTAVVRDAVTGEWALSAGTWVSVDGGASGAALRRLSVALLEDGTTLDTVARGLDGGFVLVAGSAKSGEVALLTDRVGVLHAYRGAVQGCAVVSTSALVVAAVTRAALDPDAAREALAAHSVFEQRSLWKGVEKLPAASVLRLRDGQVVSTRRWWSLGDHCWGRAPRYATPDELTDSLVEAVESMLTSHARACFDLTGGFDSRNLVAAALRTGIPFGTVVNGPPDDANVIAANGIAAAYALDHRNQVQGRDYRVPTFDDFREACALGDGEANVFDYAPTLLVQASVTKDFDLSVNGSFGEVCRGYWWDVLGVHLWSRRRFDARRLAVARFASDPWGERITRGRFEGTVAEHFTGVVERTVEDLAGLPDVAKVDAVYLRVRMQRWHGRIASLVARVRPTTAPFSARGPLEAALSMTPGTRFGGRVARLIVERLDPKLAALPLETGAPATPIRLSNLHRHVPYFRAFAARAGRALRRRVGLPVASGPPGPWRAGDVWRLAEMSDLLRVPSMRTRDLYDEEALGKLIEECRAARAAPSGTLGRVVTLELAEQAVAAARSAAPVRG